MMLEHLRLFVSRSRISSLVDRIVARSHSAVWERVRNRVSEMGVNEARGYIRVRAAQVIDRELSVASAELPHLSDLHWRHVGDQVRQRLIRLTLADVSRMHKARRKATARRAA